MEALISISILVIAVLAIQNYKLLKIIKQHDFRHKELTSANKNMAAEIKRQREFNYKAVESYNKLRESIIYLPPESGRYFSITLKNNQVIKNFSEN